MNTLKYLAQTNKLPTLDRYGVTEAKKADLDRLTNEVLIAQGEVDQMQAIVDALTEKSTQFQAYLAAADANKAKALSNKNYIYDVIQNANDLDNESEVAFTQMAIADKQMKEVSVQINQVIDKLIFSAEVVNKLANTVTREKALNPLISDELITMIATAGEDANNAVALCLVALESCYTSQASNGESESSAALEYKESLNLLEVLTGEEYIPFEGEAELQETDKKNRSIQVLLDEAYDEAVAIYNSATIANDDTTEQLDYAISNLNRAQINLQSLQAGLAAANAAALAS